MLRLELLEPEPDSDENRRQHGDDIGQYIGETDSFSHFDAGVILTHFQIGIISFRHPL